MMDRGMVSWVSAGSDRSLENHPLSVIPAKAGIQLLLD
jgi:hypothetical protein